LILARRAVKNIVADFNVMVTYSGKSRAFENVVSDNDISANSIILAKINKVMKRAGILSKTRFYRLAV